VCLKNLEIIYHLEVLMVVGGALLNALSAFLVRQRL